jgi:hypothetical protein
MTSKPSNPRQEITREVLSIPLEQIAAALDAHLEDLHGQRIGFALLVFELNKQDRDSNVAYIANAQREGCIDVLRQLLAMLEVGVTSAPLGPTVKA